MERIIIWGTGRAFYNYQVRFRQIECAGRVQIIGVVDPLTGGSRADWSVIAEDRVLDYSFDKVILGSNREELQKARQNVEKLGVPPENIQTLSQFFTELESEPEYYNAIIERQLKVLRELLDATDEQVEDYQWMYRKIAEYGLGPLYTKGRQDIFWTECGILQIIEEFTRFCNDISALKDIHRAIEVGVYRGRSSYFMCALLSRKAPDLQYYCVDISDSMDSFSRYQAVLPALVKCIPSTSADYKGRTFDFVFIDADHTYDASIEDYNNLGKYAKKIVAFHDIYAHEYDNENGGTVRMWKEVMELNKDKKAFIYSEFPDSWMGIGCIVK